MACVFLMTRPFWQYCQFWHATFNVTFDLLLKNFKIAFANLHNAPRGPSWLCQYSSVMKLTFNAQHTHKINHPMDVQFCRIYLLFVYFSKCPDLCGAAVAKWLHALGLRSKMSGVRFPAWPLEFQRLVISHLQVAIWLKYC